MKGRRRKLVFILGREHDYFGGGKGVISRTLYRWEKKGSVCDPGKGLRGRGLGMGRGGGKKLGGFPMEGGEGMLLGLKKVKVK